jgi:phage terminase small subunit
MNANNDINLNPKQKRFCEEYVIDLNATRAAIKAGYSESTAYSIGSRLLKNVEVQKYVKQIQNNLEQASGITKLKVLNSLALIAFSNISAFHNTWIEKKDFDKISDVDKAAIQEISTKVVKRNIGTSENPDIVDVEFVKLKLYDRISAISKITDILGYNANAKLDLNVDRLSDEQVEELYDRILNQITGQIKES